MTAACTLDLAGMLGHLANGRFVVEKAMHAVQLGDDSEHELHFVREHGLRERYLRALRTGRTFTVFDLRHLVRSLGADIPSYLERDVVGLVKFTLRGRFNGGFALRLAIDEARQVSGIPKALQ